MTDKTNVLLVGESWVSAAMHYKGFDQFGRVTFHLGAEPPVEAPNELSFALTDKPAHDLEECARLGGADVIVMPGCGQRWCPRSS
jgi:uncharacterized membrane protein